MQKIFLSLLLLLLTLLRSSAQEDLKKKAFVFPESSNTAHVVLKTTSQRPLTSFTLCLRSCTDLPHTAGLFSYASRRYDNEISLQKEKPNQYSLYMGTSYVTFIVPLKPTPPPGGEHVCVSWESATGLVEFWVDGQPLLRKSLMKGHVIVTEAYILLGQEQDSFGGSFDINQSLVGEITDVYMWDRVLSPEEVPKAFYNQELPGYLFNWRALNYTIKGYVVVKPALFSL
ncbi:serum amyloid P-component-like [Eublepharis macularius]|uniref:Pentraxin family member n=1 Tax=Eublepharis macularius TaxID=481883 RepID=A0AA97JQ68_EUBMA|nr:serum amyloid P-component-like [Eublepharis macularius]